MKKLLLLLATVLTVAISMSAQTGSLVREDRVWNSGHHTYHWEMLYDNLSQDGSYHFEGACEINGKTYMTLLNEDGEQVALMRQEGGKVYRCTDDNVRKYINYIDEYASEFWWDEERQTLWEEHSKEFEEEFLLYDFDAKPGDKYVYMDAPIVENELWLDGEYLGVMEIEVMDCYTINVNGADYRCQVVHNNIDRRDEYIIVEGIGCNIGLISNPMLEFPLTSGFSSSEIVTYNVADNAGNILFEYKDFATDHVGIPSYRGWEYIYASREENIVNMTMTRKCNNAALPPELLNITEYTWSYTIDEHTGELAYNNNLSSNSGTMQQVEEAGIFHDRKGVSYLSLSDEARKSMHYDGDNDVMLYDFNAKAGDMYQTFKMEQGIDGTFSNPSFEEVTVLETGYTEIERQNCRLHKVSCNGKQYSIIEGIGSVETGLLPYSNIYDPANGIYSGFRLNRVYNFVFNHNEEHIIYRVPNYIDIDNLGNTDRVEAMFGEQLGLLRYNGHHVSATGLNITVYDMSGKTVAEGFSEVSTESLQPGVYVAKAGTKTLKILVR